jgi:hypothetical protein
MSTPQVSKLDPAIEAIINRKADKGLSAEEAALARKRDLLSRVSVLFQGRMSAENELQNRDPNFKYKWVYNDPSRIQEHEVMQFQVVVSGGNDEVQTIHKREDGKHRKGDTILMRIHKDISEAWDALRELRANEAVEARRSDVETWGEQNGVPMQRKR